MRTSPPDPATQRFRAAPLVGPQQRVSLPVPFDPDQCWGRKPHHHVTGTVAGRPVRGVLVRSGDGFGLTLGPAWYRDGAVADGVEVDIELRPEGPQRDALAPDIVAALTADPAAAAFFDGLATFYRKGWLTWVDGTKRRPDERQRRIAAMVQLLAQGYKQRP